MRILQAKIKKPAQPRAKKPELTQIRLKQVLKYNPDTGVFKWRQDISGRNAGDIAGTKRDDGRIIIRIDGKDHGANRLAWLYIRGEFPGGEVGYINGVNCDNRASNLRLASHSIHLQNQKSHQNHSTSGELGVSKESRGLWRSSISVNGKNVHLGTFKTKEEAKAEYLRVKRIFHPGAPDPV